MLGASVKKKDGFDKLQKQSLLKQVYILYLQMQNKNLLIFALIIQ